MKTRIHSSMVAATFACIVGVLPGFAEPIEPVAAVQDIAALHADLAHFETFARVSEEVMFRQSLAIMGGQFGWQEDYNGQGNLVDWTLSLGTALDQTYVEAVQARQGIARSRVFSDDVKQAGEDLFASFRTMTELGREIQRLLQLDDVQSAAEIYEKDLLDLRNFMVREVASTTIQLRNAIQTTALDVRLGRKTQMHELN